MTFVPSVTGNTSDSESEDSRFEPVGTSKTCTVCGEHKPLTEFSIKGKGTHTWCKACKRLHNKRDYLDRTDYHRKRISEKQAEYRDASIALIRKEMEDGCVDCGIKDVRVLEFDHKDPNKNFNIGGSLGRKSPAKLAVEIEKCEVVCANCHRIRTLERSGSWRAIHAPVG